jgi:hypothetical protein
MVSSVATTGICFNSYNFHLTNTFLRIVAIIIFITSQEHLRVMLIVTCVDVYCLQMETFVLLATLYIDCYNLDSVIKF